MDFNKRNLIKSSVVVACAGIAGACNRNENVAQENKNIILPKQTGQYQISTPLPFSFDAIDKMYEYNKTLKKSKIITLYNNIPNPLMNEFNGFFQCQKGYNEQIKTYDDFFKYVKYAKEKGFKFIYLMNSPKGISQEDFNKHGSKFYELLDILHDLNCDDIKVANTQVAQLINEYKHKFTLSASTAFEFHNVTQYYNLLKTYPNIKTIDIAIDDNRNFLFLKGLKKMFPDVNIEIMVNEPCMRGCPARISHSSSSYCIYKGCDNVKHYIRICKTGNVYPWDLEYYSAIGINNFKLITIPFRSEFKDINFIKKYLDAIENNIDNMPLSYLFEMFGLHKKIKKNIAIGEIKHLLPDIKHFIQYGDKCANICGIECNYCMSCADKLKKTYST